MTWNGCGFRSQARTSPSSAPTILLIVGVDDGMGFRDRKQRRELGEAIKRGRSLRANGEEGAAEFLEDAARRFPESPEFPLLLASVYLESRPDDVLGQVAGAAELGRNDPDTQVRRGPHVSEWERRGGSASLCDSRGGSPRC